MYFDYLDGLGVVYGGCVLGLVEFDGCKLGVDFNCICLFCDVFMGLGGMMVGWVELGSLLNLFFSVVNFCSVMKILFCYGCDCLWYWCGMWFLMGNVLVVWLFYSLW